MRARNDGISMSISESKLKRSKRKELLSNAQFGGTFVSSGFTF